MLRGDLHIHPWGDTMVLMSDTTIRTLAGKLLVEIDAKGKATPLLCSWLVRVPTYHPEPDSIEDTYRDVECGTRTFDDGHGSYHCEAGHRHVSFEDPEYSSYEAEIAWQERQEDGRW